MNMKTRIKKAEEQIKPKVERHSVLIHIHHSTTDQEQDAIKSQVMQAYPELSESDLFIFIVRYGGDPKPFDMNKVQITGCMR